MSDIYFTQSAKNAIMEQWLRLLRENPNLSTEGNILILAWASEGKRVSADGIEAHLNPGFHMYIGERDKLQQAEVLNLDEEIDVALFPEGIFSSGSHRVDKDSHGIILVSHP